MENLLEVFRMDVNHLGKYRWGARLSTNRRVGTLSLLVCFFTLSFLNVPAQQKNKVSDVRSSGGFLRPSETSANSGDQSPHKAEDKSDVDGIENLDIEELARAGLKNEAKMYKELLNYTYNLKKTRRTLNEVGKETDKDVGVFEAYPVKGEHVLITLVRNGKALPYREMEVARRIAGRELEIAAREEEKQKARGEAPEKEPENFFSAGIIGKYRGKNGHISINPADFLRLCELTSPSLKKVNERDVVVMKFQPRRDAKFPYPKSYIAKLTGEVWIDLTDKTLLRIEGWPAQEVLAGNQNPRPMPKEPVLIYEQKRLADGNWVPMFIRMNAEGDETLFNGLNWDVQLEFNEYKRFNTAVGDVKVDAKEKN
jgi:hypothetical protein